MITEDLYYIIMRADGKGELCHRLKRFLMLGVLSLLFFLPLQAQVVEHKDDTLDFRLCFELLTKNRQAYNRYNDSIYSIKNHAKWVNYFKRRAIKNHQLFVANQEIIRSIKAFLRQHSDSIPQDLYTDFCMSLQRGYVSRKMSDPFVLLTMVRYLERGGSYLPDSVKATNIFNLWRLHSYIQMWNLGGNIEYLQKAYEAGKAIFSEDAKKYPQRLFAIAGALRYMPRTMWMVHHLQTMDEFQKMHRILGEFLQRPDVDDYMSPEHKSALLSIQKTKDEDLLRNVFLVDSTVVGKTYRDSLLNAVIDRNLASDDLSNLSHVRTIFFQMMSYRLTSKQAWQQIVDGYNRIRLDFISKPLDDVQVEDFMMPTYTFLYVNDVADVPMAEKKRIIWRMCNDIVTIYTNRKDFQETTDFVRDLYRLATNELLIKYLSDRQLSKFYNRLCVSTQISTYAHCVHVAKISELLMKEVLKHRPQLLLGIWNSHTVADVKNRKRDFSKFIFNAAMLHDLGKIAMCSVVNNEYLPLSDEEYDIIKQHPLIGARLTEIVPRFAKYHDLILGHHKWYNGKGGYPGNFDNTKSPVRFFIDIVTLSDCLQAATEKVGRNYKIGKQFEVVMAELREGAGTRYNPDLVDMIDHQPCLRKHIENLLGDGWVNIYYRIYSKFMLRGGNEQNFSE